MNKLLIKICGNRKGSALLVALLVMGVLIAVSLSLSTLILGESRATRELIDAGRAYYAAESGIEQALYKLDTSLPGWEGEEEGNLGKVGENGVFSYSVKNKCNVYPCFDEDEYDIDDALFQGSEYDVNNHKFYDVLDLNETITIPLFTVSNGKVVPVKEFTVEFYMAFNPTRDLYFENASEISGWDVLRWKVFGLKNTNDGFRTESIHDFTAVSALNTIATIDADEDPVNTFASNAVTPSWFGTIDCDDASPRGNGVDWIHCNTYNFIDTVSKSSKDDICLQTEARDYYKYDDEGKRFESKHSCYDIGVFMEEITPSPDQEIGDIGPTGLNYLSLTNLMNPALIRDSDINKKEEKSKIYFRVETYEDDTVREFAKITADGYSGDSKQSLKVEIKRDSYMPVFNFSIYSTYGSEDFYVHSAVKPPL